MQTQMKNNTREYFEMPVDYGSSIINGAHIPISIFFNNNQEIIVKTSRFVIVPKSIQGINGEARAHSTISHHNGQPWTISNIYQTKILELSNTTSKDFYFSFSEVSLSIELYVYFSNIRNDQINNPKTLYLEKVKKAIKSFETALQIVGFTKQINSTGLALKRNTINLKKKIANSIKRDKMSSILKQGLPKQKSVVSTDFAIQKVKSIIQIQSQNNLQQNGKSSKKGGYLQVQKKQCKIIGYDNNMKEQRVQMLACKTAKKKQQIQAGNLPVKLKKQLQFVEKVKNPKYLGTYYKCQEETNTLYMEFIPEVLKDYIYKKNLTLSEHLYLSRELVEAVKIFHQSGIVHRDLKPQNVLIDASKEKKVLKVIDFGQSAFVSQKYDKKKPLGCTMPYSPPECLVGAVQGYNKTQIDNWSLGVIFYQMTYKSIPFTFSRILGGDIIESWRHPDNFEIFPIIRKRRGLRVLEQLISLMTISALQPKQQNRLSLNAMDKCLQIAQNYESECSQQIIFHCYQ